jgi:uncharacterized protein (TIGR01244 family)
MKKIVFLTPDFAVTSQLEPADFAEAAQKGFKHIVNNRPDGEEDGQLANSAAAAHARRHRLQYHHIPAGKLDLFSDPVVNATENALAGAQGPVLAYCKSGTRSAIIWAAATARGLPADDVLRLLESAGFEFDFLRDDLEEQFLAGRQPDEALRKAA